jgi:hypothetical protein
MKTPRRMRWRATEVTREARMAATHSTVSRVVQMKSARKSGSVMAVVAR